MLRLDENNRKLKQLETKLESARKKKKKNKKKEIQKEIDLLRVTIGDEAAAIVLDAKKSLADVHEQSKALEKRAAELKVFDLRRRIDRFSVPQSNIRKEFLPSLDIQHLNDLDDSAKLDLFNALLNSLASTILLADTTTSPEDKAALKKAIHSERALFTKLATMLPDENLQTIKINYHDPMFIRRDRIGPVANVNVNTFSADITADEFSVAAQAFTKEELSNLGDQLSYRVRNADEFLTWSLSATLDTKLREQIIATRNDQKALYERIYRYQLDRGLAETNEKRKKAQDAHDALIQCIEGLEARDDLSQAQRDLLVAGRLLANENNNKINNPFEYDYQFKICTAARDVLESTPENQLERLQAYQNVMGENKLGSGADYTGSIAFAPLIFFGAALIVAGICFATLLWSLPIALLMVGIGVGMLSGGIALTVMDVKTSGPSGNTLLLPKFNEAACSKKFRLFGPKPVVDATVANDAEATLSGPTH